MILRNKRRNEEVNKKNENKNEVEEHTNVEWRDVKKLSMWNGEAIKWICGKMRKTRKSNRWYERWSKSGWVEKSEE